MADKPRVKAPKQRVTQRQSDPGRTRRMMLIGGGALAAVAVVFAGVALGLGGGDPSAAEVREKVVAAGGTLREVPAQPGDHTLGPDDTSEDWNTDPPTSGEHFGFDNNRALGTAIWGVYEEPLQLARLVHNLEHGGAYILYGDKVQPGVVAQLRAFYDDHQNGTILAPYPKLGNRIALGAWVYNEGDEGDGTGYLARLAKFDEDAFSAFFQAFQFKGPERFPSDSLLPGQS
jgi:hypothetical protein